jgi:hypothetical protein
VAYELRHTSRRAHGGALQCTCSQSVHAEHMASHTQANSRAHVKRINVSVLQGADSLWCAWAPSVNVVGATATNTRDVCGTAMHSVAMTSGRHTAEIRIKQVVSIASELRSWILHVHVHVYV